MLIPRNLRVHCHLGQVNLDEDLLEGVLVGNPHLAGPEADDGAVRLVAPLDELPDLAGAEAPAKVHGRQGSVPRARDAAEWRTVGFEDAAQLDEYHGGEHGGHAEDDRKHRHGEVSLAKVRVGWGKKSVLVCVFFFVLQVG